MYGSEEENGRHGPMREGGRKDVVVWYYREVGSHVGVMVMLMHGRLCILHTDSLKIEFISISMTYFLFLWNFSSESRCMRLCEQVGELGGRADMHMTMQRPWNASS